MAATFPSKRSELHFLFWTPMLLIILFFIVPDWWPPAWLERHTQRQQAVERFQLAGGWDAVRQGCVSLAELHTNGFFTHWRETNGLPAPVATLKPGRVEYDPACGCVRIWIFGMHRTGGHSTPYFGLEVDTSSNSVAYQHGNGYEQGGVNGDYRWTADQVAQGIYEIY